MVIPPPNPDHPEQRLALAHATQLPRTQFRVSMGARIEGSTFRKAFDTGRVFNLFDARSQRAFATTQAKRYWQFRFSLSSGFNLCDSVVLANKPRIEGLTIPDSRFTLL